MSTTITPEFPAPVIDEPETYTPIAELRYDYLTSAVELTAILEKDNRHQQRELEHESEILGINPKSQPDDFLEARKSVLEEAKDGINERLPSLKQRLVDETVDYFYRDNPETSRQLREKLTQRLAATQKIGVHDTLAHKKQIGGRFSPRSRQIAVSSGEIAKALYDSGDEGDFYDHFDNTVVMHELIHGMFSSGRQEVSGKSKTVIRSIRNGLQVEQWWHDKEKGATTGYTYATWLNEATVESFRQTIAGKDVRYNTEVMILHTLDELAPGLRDSLVLAAIDGKGPGSTYAKIEELLGPTAIDDIEELLEKQENEGGAYQFDSLKDAVAAMLPEDLQEKGRLILDEKEEEVYANAPHYKEWKAYYRQQAEN